MSEHDPIDEEYMLHTNYSWDNFKVLNNNNNTNDSIRRIAVFEHQSRTHVRVYESTSREYYFRCIECHSKEQEVKAKLSTDGLMFKVFEPFTHICSPKRYLDALMIANAPAPVASSKQPQNEESMPSSSSAEEEIDIVVNKKKQTAKKKASKKKTKKSKWIEFDSSNFEYGCSVRRTAKARLMVFEYDRRDKVQVYGIEKNKRHYKCLKCNVARAYVSKDTVRVLRDHSCPLQSYAKVKEEQEKITKLRIVQPEEFEYGMNQKYEAKKRLIIFEPNSDRKLCREYSYNSKNAAFVCMKCLPNYVSAKVFKDENGIEFVEASNAHRCKPRRYKGIKAEQNSFKKISGQLQYFKSPNFEFLLNTRGVENGRLIIFTTKTKVYQYYRSSRTKIVYHCLGCERDPHNVRKKAFITKDENGNECIEADMSHVCERISYKEVLEEQERIKELRVIKAKRNSVKPFKKIRGIKAVPDSFEHISDQLQIFKTPDFMFSKNTRGAENGRLIIFTTKTKAYEYYRVSPAQKVYLCLGCERKPHNVRKKAYVIKDENGNECIEADMSHVCEAINYEEILKGPFKNNSDQVQVFKSLNFKFLLNTTGAENGRLIIFSTKTKVYQYYRQTKNIYRCLGCHRPHNVMKKAYIIEDEDGNECITADMSHVCERISYKEVLEEQERIKERHGLL